MVVRAECDDRGYYECEVRLGFENKREMLPRNEIVSFFKTIWGLGRGGDSGFAW